MRVHVYEGGVDGVNNEIVRGNPSPCGIILREGKRDWEAFCCLSLPLPYPLPSIMSLLAAPECVML